MKKIRIKTGLPSRCACTKSFNKNALYIYAVDEFDDFNLRIHKAINSEDTDDETSKSLRTISRFFMANSADIEVKADDSGSILTIPDELALYLGIGSDSNDVYEEDFTVIHIKSGTDSFGERYELINTSLA